MLYCINPKCKQRENSDNLEFCQACSTPLLIKNRYRLLFPLKPLSGASQTEVFEVEDLGVEAVKGERYKIIKVLKNDDHTLVRLFKQEVKALNKLNHPGLPRINLGDGYFTVSIPNKAHPLHCLVLEKIEGDDLLRWVEKNGTISQAEALQWLIQMLKILAYLHQNKYFHRDIKPSNIIKKPDGQLVLIDFGTVRDMTVTYLVRKPKKEEVTCFWSPGYTPDEAISGKAVPQSDFYALGRTLVHLLTGKPPLELLQESEQLNWRERAPQVSQLLADWIDYLMASSPLQRPPSASFILQYLEGKKVENLPSPPARNIKFTQVLPSETLVPPWVVYLGLGLFALLLGTGLLWFQKKANKQLNIQQREELSSPIKK